MGGGRERRVGVPHSSDGGLSGRGARLLAFEKWPSTAMDGGCPSIRVKSKDKHVFVLIQSHMAIRLNLFE